MYVPLQLAHLPYTSGVGAGGIEQCTVSATSAWGVIGADAGMTMSYHGGGPLAASGAHLLSY